MGRNYGQVFRLESETPSVEGCTISREVTGGATYFALGAGTSISPESHPEAKLVLVTTGELTASVDDKDHAVRAGEALLVPAGALFGVEAGPDTGYVDFGCEGANMDKQGIEAGVAQELAGLAPYQDGVIVNRDVLRTPGMKLVVMAFDEGCALSEHAAPGEALVMALDGEATITYGGVENKVRAGECFRFAKGGRHAVKADTRFKMALAVGLA